MQLVYCPLMNTAYEGHITVMKELKNLRADSSTWDGVAFAACESKERGRFDSNERERLRVSVSKQ